MNVQKIAPLTACLALSIAGFAAHADNHGLVKGTSHDDVVAVMKASFAEKGMAKLDRLDQTPMQAACSQAELSGKPLTADQSAKITKAALESVKKPADGKYLGDWKAGEKVAQSGRGLQTSDKPGSPSGGNCYACHQMTKAEISFGNIGPSLLHYGKVRGNSQEIIDYTWNKIYNSHTTNACSVMPRFGDAGILTEQQMKDVMALLFDPNSPVNNDSVIP
jgi:sulfur-oxidizing protein SoxX